MIQHSNIDRTDATLNTKYPFEWACKLQINGIELQSLSFLSVCIYMTEDMQIPARISRITTSELVFSDAQGYKIGTANIHPITNADTVSIPYVNTLIRDEYGVIRGHITMRSATPLILIGAVKLFNSDTFDTDQNDFILLPSCHISSMRGSAKALVIQDVAHTADITLKSRSQTRVSLSSNNNAMTYGLSPVYSTDASAKNYICKLKVNGIVYDVSDKHLLITHALTSNLRITQDANNIKLLGVTDV